MLFAEFLVGSVEIQSEMYGKTVKDSAAPAVSIVVQCRFNKRTLPERSFGIGNKECGVNAHCRSDATAGRTGTRRIIERELPLMHFTSDEMMLCTAEPFVESRELRSQPRW